jgi:hypothetical protein
MPYITMFYFNLNFNAKSCENDNLVSIVTASIFMADSGESRATVQNT